MTVTTKREDGEMTEVAAPEELEANRGERIQFCVCLAKFDPDNTNVKPNAEAINADPNGCSDRIKIEEAVNNGDGVAEGGGETVGVGLNVTLGEGVNVRVGNGVAEIVRVGEGLLETDGLGVPVGQ
jgi:hypothetical protein